MVPVEVIEISFDVLTHHRQCWRLLQAVKDACRDNLITMYGSDYIVKETELPFILGYVLMAAANTTKLGNWTSQQKSIALCLRMLHRLSMS